MESLVLQCGSFTNTKSGVYSNHLRRDWSVSFDCGPRSGLSHLKHLCFRFFWNPKRMTNLVPSLLASLSSAIIVQIIANWKHYKNIAKIFGEHALVWCSLAFLQLRYKPQSLQGSPYWGRGISTTNFCTTTKQRHNVERCSRVEWQKHSNKNKTR